MIQVGPSDYVVCRLSERSGIGLTLGALDYFSSGSRIMVYYRFVIRRRRLSTG
jgi:hypothetical protein